MEIKKQNIGPVQFCVLGAMVLYTFGIALTVYSQAAWNPTKEYADSLTKVTYKDGVWQNHYWTKGDIPGNKDSAQGDVYVWEWLSGKKWSASPSPWNTGYIYFGPWKDASQTQPQPPDTVTHKGDAWISRWWNIGEEPGIVPDSGAESSWWFLNSKGDYVWEGCTDGIPCVCIPTWKDGARGAYSIIHDDMCGTGTEGIVTAVEALNSRSLTCGISSVTSFCSDSDWALQNQFVAAGHEIICHSFNHTSPIDDWLWHYDSAGNVVLKELISTGWNDSSKILNVSRAKRMIDSLVAAQTCVYYCFPLDKYSTPLINYLDSCGFIGARAGSRNGVPMRGNFSNGFRLDFDVYFNDTTVPNEHQLLTMNGMIDSIIRKNGYMVRELHGVGTDSGWGPIPLAFYEKHLDYIKAKQDSLLLWVGTPSEVVRYRFTTDLCGVPKLTYDSNGVVISFPDAAIPVKYATEISLIVSTSTDVSTVTAVQGVDTLVTRKLGASRFAVYANPLRGPVTVAAPVGIVFFQTNRPAGISWRMHKNTLVVSVSAGKYAMQLFTANGRALGKAVNGHAHHDNVPALLDIKGLSEGFYLLSVKHTRGKAVLKVVLSQ